jgi:hypothetical protein
MLSGLLMFLASFSTNNKMAFKAKYGVDFSSMVVVHNARNPWSLLT